MPRICHCLECQFDEHAHKAEPMCHFYGSRVRDGAPGLGKDVLGRAKRFLEACQVYTLEEIPQLVESLGMWFGLDVRDYRPEHVSGHGAKVRPDQRRLVARNHPLDAELYEWARGRT